MVYGADDTLRLDACGPWCAFVTTFHPCSFNYSASPPPILHNVECCGGSSEVAQLSTWSGCSGQTAIKQAMRPIE